MKTFDGTNPSGSVPNGQGELADRAKDLAADAGREVLARANEQGARGMSKLGDQLERAADFVNTNVGQSVEKAEIPVLRREHVEKVAGGIRDAAGYLRDADPATLIEDVDTAIRRHPYRAMFIGLGLGYVVGRLMRSDD